GVFILSASYTDKGGENIKPLTGSNVATLQNSTLDLSKASDVQGFSSFNMDGRNLLIAPARLGYVSFTQVDLTDITAINIMAGSQQPLKNGYKVVIKMDGPEGATIGESTIDPKSSAGQGPFNSVSA